VTGSGGHRGDKDDVMALRLHGLDQAEEHVLKSVWIALKVRPNGLHAR